MENTSYNHNLESALKKFSGLGLTPEGRQVFEKYFSEIYYNIGIPDKDKRSEMVQLFNSFAKYQKLSTGSSIDREANESILSLMASIGRRLGLSVTPEGISANFSGAGPDFDTKKPLSSDFVVTR